MDNISQYGSSLLEGYKCQVAQLSVAFQIVKKTFKACYWSYDNGHFIDKNRAKGLQKHSSIVLLY